MSISIEQYQKLRGQGMTPQQIARSSKGTAFERFSLGFVKGGLKTVQGISKIGAAVSNKILPGNNFQPLLSKGAEQRLLTPVTTAEKGGFAVEKLAEFLTPSKAIGTAQTLVSRAIPGAGKLAGLSRIGARAGVDALATGGIATIQEGEINDNVKVAAITAGLFSGGLQSLSAVKRGSVKGVGKLGEKIQESVLRPSLKDVKEGFKIGNVRKYKLGGNPAQVFAKSNARVNSLVRDLNTKIQAGGDKQIDLARVLSNVQKDFSGGQMRNFGDNRLIEKGVADLFEEIKTVSPTGRVGLVEAQLIKRGAGSKGAWAYGMADRDAVVRERIYSKFYSILKTEIEKNAPAGVKEINRQISEVLPIIHAAIRRMPVEARNNALSLTDAIGLYAAAFDPRALALIGANKLSKSGRFANFLMNVADNYAQKVPTTSVGARFTGRPTKAMADTPTPEAFGKNTQGGFIKNPLSSADDPLLTEARKYKSAEEFVKNTPDVYLHGTARDGTFDLNEGMLFLTKDKNAAGRFANDPFFGAGREGGIGRVEVIQQVRTGKSKTVVVPKNIGNKIDDFIRNEATKAKKDGYRFIEFTHPEVETGVGGFQTKVSLFPKEDLKLITDGKMPDLQDTIQKDKLGLPVGDKLTDIWKKAQGR